MAEQLEHRGDDPGRTFSLSESSAPQVVVPDIIDVRFIFQRLLRWSWLIVLVTLIGIAKGLWDMHNFRPAAVATMTVLPSGSGSAAAGVGGLAGGLGVGGLAGALAGVASSTQLSEFDRLVQATSTVTLARELQEKYGMLQLVYASSWDVNTNTWIRPSGTKFEIWQEIYRNFNFNTWSIPTEEDLAKYLGGNFVVEEIEDTGFKKIEFVHEDPEIALFLLTSLYNEASELLRLQDLEESRKRVNYLQNRLSDTGVINLRESLLQLLASQARREMLLQGDAPFGGKIVEPPFISKYRTEPNHLLLLGIPGFLGFSMAVAVIVLIALYKNE